MSLQFVHFNDVSRKEAVGLGTESLSPCKGHVSLWTKFSSITTRFLAFVLRLMCIYLAGFMFLRDLLVMR